MKSSKPLPEFVLFGDSLTEWSFSENTQGFGLFLEKWYTGKVTVLNEGRVKMTTQKHMHEILNTNSYTSTALERDFDRIITRATSPNAAPTLLFTIFLGANDACIIGSSEYVPWLKFEANIRKFIETILTHDAMASTKIVLITPPPIGIPARAMEKDMSPEEVEDTNALMREQRSFKTYMSKKRYAEGVMKIAGEYEETGRVTGLDFWREIVNARIDEDKGVEGNGEAVREYDDDMPPGCGLIGATVFGKGWFTDGLHLDVKGYSVLSKTLFEQVTKKWPELTPDNL